MLLHNASEWSKAKSIWLGLLVCMLLTASTTLIRIAIHNYVQPSLPFQIFYISVIVTAFYFGWLFGLLAAILATISGFYFFIQPYDSFAQPSVSDCYVIAVNISTMMACVFVVEFLQRSSYASSVMLKASRNNYRLFIRSENQLLNLKQEIAEHKKLINAITSVEDHPLLWADPYEIICYFEKSTQIIPADLLNHAESKFLNLFSAKQHPIVLNHINTALNENTVVEFNFVWATELKNEHDLVGRITPVSIDRKKSLVFSVTKQKIRPLTVQ